MDWWFFIVFSCIWAAADHFIAPPIASLIAYIRKSFSNKAELAESQKSTAKFNQLNIGLSECIVGIGLGAICGLFFGPVIAVSFTQTAWSWIATGLLIITSFIFSLISDLIIYLLS